MAHVSFLMGSEEGEKQTWLDEETMRLRKEHPDMETVRLFAFDVDASTLEDALFSPSLFSSFTLVVLKHYEQLQKNSPVNKVIARYASCSDEPASRLVVISSESAYSLPSSISKAVRKEDVITFWELFENRKQDWIRTFFRKAGYQIDQDAIRYILDMIDNNTQAMKDTCSLLAIFFDTTHGEGGRRIRLDDIASYVSHTRSEDGFTLFAQIAKGDLERALSSLHRILVTDSRGYMSIVGILLRQFRLLESFLTLSRDVGEEKALENACALSTSGTEVKGIRSVRDKQTFRIAKSNYSLDDCRRIIPYLDGMDISVRNAGTDEVALTLELMVYTIIVGKGRCTSLRLERELFDDSLGHGEGH